MNLRTVGRRFTQMMTYFLVMNSKWCIVIVKYRDLSGFTKIWGRDAGYFGLSFGIGKSYVLVANTDQLGERSVVSPIKSNCKLT